MNEEPALTTERCHYICGGESIKTIRHRFRQEPLIVDSVADHYVSWCAGNLKLVDGFREYNYMGLSVHRSVDDLYDLSIIAGTQQVYLRNHPEIIEFHWRPDGSRNDR